MTLSYTPRFHLAVPDFLSEPWHAEFAAAMESIDQALYTAIVAQETNLWLNDHVYAIGDIIIDPTTGTLYAAAANHTSSGIAIAPTFMNELALHPTYWTSFAVTAASQSEAEVGVENSKYMTPLRTAQAITAQSPTPGIATQTQAQEGIDNTQIMTPLRVSQGITARIASQVQAEAATDNTVLMTPLRVEQQIAATGIAGAQQICFSAHKNGVNQTGIANNTTTKITFPTELYDFGNRFDVANSRWTPPNGAIHIESVVNIAGATVAGSLVLQIQKNGVVLRQGTTIVSSNTSEYVSVEIDDVANGTDFYEVFVNCPSASTLTATGLAINTYFMGHFLGQVGTVTLGAGQTGFRAHKNNVSQNIPNSTYTKVTFGFEDYDQGSFFDTTLSRWIPPTGLVHLDASVYFPSAATGSYVLAGIYKNSAILKQCVVPIGASAASQISVDDSASGTDYYELYVFTASGSVAPLDGALINTWFGGHFLGGSRGIQGIQGPIGADGAITAPAINSGRLRLVSATLLSFTPYNGDRVKINGVLQQIPSAGIAGLSNTGAYVNGVAGQSLAANTLYYVYAFMNGAVVTADFSSTGHATSAAAGNAGTEIKVGDDTRTLIGMIRTGGTGGVQFLDAAANRFVLSWFNRRTIRVAAGEGNNYLPPGAWYETSNTRVNFLSWGDENIFVGTHAKTYSDGDDTIYGGVVIDTVQSAGQNVAYTLATQHGGWWQNQSCSGGWELTEGFHFMFCTSLGSSYNYHVQAALTTTIRG